MTRKEFNHSCISIPAPIVLVRIKEIDRRKNMVQMCRQHFCSSNDKCMVIECFIIKLLPALVSLSTG